VSPTTKPTIRPVLLSEEEDATGCGTETCLLMTLTCELGDVPYSVSIKK